MAKFFKENNIIDFDWDIGALVEVVYDHRNNIVSIMGNHKGFKILGEIMLALSEEDIPDHFTVHLDAARGKWNGFLVDTSIDLRLIRKKSGKLIDDTPQ
jgi:hypothetical protein